MRKRKKKEHNETVSRKTLFISFRCFAAEIAIVAAAIAAYQADWMPVMTNISQPVQVNLFAEIHLDVPSTNFVITARKD